MDRAWVGGAGRRNHASESTWPLMSKKSNAAESSASLIGMLGPGWSVSLISADWSSEGPSRPDCCDPRFMLVARAPPTRSTTTTTQNPLLENETAETFTGEVHTGKRSSDRSFHSANSYKMCFPASFHTLSVARSECVGQRMRRMPSCWSR